MRRGLGGRGLVERVVPVPHEMVQALAAVGGSAAGVGDLLSLRFARPLLGRALLMVVAAERRVNLGGHELLVVAEVRRRPAHLHGQGQREQQEEEASHGRTDSNGISQSLRIRDLTSVAASPCG